jgi:hypothetical protein
MIRRNYAKSFDGFKTRILAKITSLTLVQYINKFIFDRPIKILKIKSFNYTQRVKDRKFIFVLARARSSHQWSDKIKRKSVFFIFLIEYLIVIFLNELVRSSKKFYKNGIILNNAFAYYF